MCFVCLSEIPLAFNPIITFNKVNSKFSIGKFFHNDNTTLLVNQGHPR